MKSILKPIFIATMITFSAQTIAATNAANNPTDNVSPAERAKIEEVVHQYLLRKPEVLVEAMQILQRKQYEQAEQTVKQTQSSAASFAKALFNQNNDPVAGNPNGKVTVVEFFDYQCPHCVDMAPVMQDAIKANPELRVVYKEFPIRGPVSEFASRAALAANQQGKYVEFSHALLSSKQQLTQESILKAAQDVGLDVEKLKKDMNGTAVSDQLKANIKLAQDLKLFGTPAFFIGKTGATSSDKINYIPGVMDKNQLQGMIDQASK